MQVMHGFVNGAKIELLSFHQDKKLDIIATYRYDGKIGHAIVRTSQRGESYFNTHGNRVYITDLRRN